MIDPSAHAATMTTIVNNYIGGKVEPPSSNEYLDVIDPATSGIIGKVVLSTAADVDAAAAALESWSAMIDEQSSGGHHARVPLAITLECQ